MPVGPALCDHPRKGGGLGTVLVVDLRDVCVTRGFRGTECCFYTKMPSILISLCALSMTTAK